MNIQLRPVPDQERLAQYASARLNDGGALSCIVARQLRNRSGRGFILASPVENLSKLDFRRGGMMRVGDTIGALAAWLTMKLPRERSCALFEHALAKRGDAFLEKLASPPALYADGVYFLLNRHGVSLEAARASVMSAESALGLIGFIISADQVAVDRHGELLLGDRFDQSVRAIILSSCDGETYALWCFEHHS